MKKLMSFILVLSLMICVVPVASATNDEAVESAEVLYELELMRMALPFLLSTKLLPVIRL